MNELSYTQLKNQFDVTSLNFKTTKEIDSYSNIISTDRALDAIEFGLRNKIKGFNIYASGMSGTGKTTCIKALAKKIAETEPVPPDICYVYNFENPKEARKLILPPGMGIALREEMDELINYLLDDLPKAFNTKDYNNKKSDIIKQYQNKKDDIIKEITNEAKEQNFGVKTTNTGIYFMPIMDGEIISEEQFELLPQEEKDIITQNSTSMQNRALETMRKLKSCDKNMAKELSALDYSIGLFEVGRYLNDLFSKYNNLDDVVKYLSDAKEDILENINNFMEKDEEDETEQVQLYLPLQGKKDIVNTFDKYKVNVLVDNSKLTCAPVIVDYNPTYVNLAGEIEYENEFGNLITDFTKIKPGLLHKANGGYLILQANDLFKNPMSWELLRRVLKTNSLKIEPSRELNTGFALSSMTPEPIKLNLKIILVGSEIYYRTLYEYDEDFSKLFKVLADFDYETNFSEKSVLDTIQFIKNFVIREHTPEFDAEAIGKIIEYSNRIANSQNKLTMQFNLLAEILSETVTWARLDEAKIVTKNYVEKAIREHEYRLSLYEEKLNEMITENIIMVDTEGSKVGQINGLAVLSTGNYSFGKPSRITATTYVGKSGIVNIEKEADLSGSIHDKGIQVLIGYLGHTYAQDFPLSLSCRICFEQNYNGVDGDSASSTELYAVLSSLSGCPIRQDIAVTGSINQFGEIQPIGGVTHKIEGFFDLCKKRTLTGTQGVIIPMQNVKDLTLNDEVVNAVKNGMFHIYAIKNVDEGIEILTGVPAGVKNEKGKFPSDSIHGLVIKKLKTFHKKSMGEE